MCARGERLAAMNCTDSHNYSDVADLEMAHTMLHRYRQNIMLLGGLFRTCGQHVHCARVLGVIEGDDASSVVRVAHCSHEQGDATNLRP